MSGNIWTQLERPMRILAPMEDVTDTVFRQIVGSLAPPDLYFTEFLRADLFQPRFAGRMQRRLEFSEAERPIIAQIWGNDTRDYGVAAARLAQLGYDGIDINMGCPAPKLVKKGCCAGLIRTPLKAAELYAAACEGAQGVPVSIKTRIGLDTPETEDWIGFLLQLRPAALTVHGRTAAEMSDPPADWSQVRLAVELRNRISPSTVMVGNGDIRSESELQAAAAASGVEGVMIGRGIFEDLLAFRRSGASWVEQPREVVLETFIRHIELHRIYWQGERNFEILKKFARAYLHGLPDFDSLYREVMRYHDHDSLVALLQRSVQQPFPELK
ncbi:MAG: tRNA-dihydrouridine synthase [Spirochaeta sp.]|nr:tRNA-dihydrouridine synthase [Spirochaeta sp.]